MLSFILFLLILAAEPSHAESLYRPDPPGKILRRLKSVTASERPNRIDFGDPSLPDFSENGVVRVYTTGGEVLVWRSKNGESAQQRFLRGIKPLHQKLKVYHADGVTPFDAEVSGEDVWDPSVRVLRSGEKVMYGGAMRPSQGRNNALWPDDHWSRRTHAFRHIGGRWIMEPESMWKNDPLVPTWIGHNYGHDLLTDEEGRTYMFYERVTEDRNGLPWKTELFARPLIDPFTLGKPEIPIFVFGPAPWPSTERSFGGYLAEGPRVFKAAGHYLIGFSAGDYNSDHYGIHLLWSNRLTGPYRPYLQASGKDLFDFGQAIEGELKLKWGAARPAFFQVDGKWWVLFHGIDPRFNSDFIDGKRAIYLAPVRITRRARGGPKVEILVREN